MQKWHPARASNWKVVDLFLGGNEFAGDGREKVSAGDQTGRREREWVKRDRAAGHSSRRWVLSVFAFRRQRPLLPVAPARAPSAAVVKPESLSGRAHFRPEFKSRRCAPPFLVHSLCPPSSRLLALASRCARKMDERRLENRPQVPVAVETFSSPWNKRHN